MLWLVMRSSLLAPTSRWFVLEPYIQDTRPRMGGQWVGQVDLGDDFEFTDQEIGEFFMEPVVPKKMK